MAKNIYENAHTGDLIITNQLGGSLVFSQLEEDDLLERLLQRKLIKLETIEYQRILKLEKENKRLKEMLYPWK